MSDFTLPFLPEHSPVEKQMTDEKNADHEITEEEKKTGELVEKLFEKAKTKKSSYDQAWPTYYRMFRGDQWTRKRPSYLHMEVINFIFQAIQSQVPIMTDARPKPNFTPQNPDDIILAEILNDLLESDWQAGKWQFKLSEVLYDGKFYGTGFSHLFFDKEADNSLGRIRLKSESPYDIYPDASATAINEDDSDYFIVGKIEEINKVKARYSGHKYADYIKADMDDLTKDHKLSAQKPTIQHNTNLQMPKGEYYSGEEGLNQDMVLVLTCYMRPKDVVEEEKDIIEETTGEIKKEFITKKKYPRGRKIVKINKYIMEDVPLELPDLKFPYQMYVNYIDPRCFWGISEIEPLESPQKIFNKIVSFALDVLTLMGNPVWLIPTSTGLQPGQFSNAPGMQIPYDGPNPPSRQEGVQLQPYVMSMIDRLENWFNSISGSTDVSRGVAPGSVTAASAIENLQDSAKTRIREQMRHMDCYLTEMGEQYQQLVFENYTVPRIFRLTDQQGLDKFFRFHVEHMKTETGDQVLDDKGDPVRVAVVQKYQKKDEKYVANSVPDKFVIQGKFDLKVNTGSGLPFNKQEKEQRLFQFFQAGLIDEEEVLKQADYPNYEVVLERVRAKQQQMAQMQAQPKQ